MRLRARISELRARSFVAPCDGQGRRWRQAPVGDGVWLERTAGNWNMQPSPWGQVEKPRRPIHGTGPELAATRRPWLGPLIWPAVCPQLVPDDPWRGFALCADDGGERPAAEALGSASRAPALLPPGDHAVDHPALRYHPVGVSCPPPPIPAPTAMR